MSVERKTIVVTGGFGALGRTVAAKAIEQGARVALLDRAPLPHGTLADDQIRIPDIDLTDFAATKAAMEQVVAATGGIDVLFNIAGGFRFQTLEDGELAVWDELYELNLKTALVACRAALPYLRASGAGRIVNVGAAGAVRAGFGMGAYAASKAAVAKLTESLAEELKDAGVTVNAVLPSIIDTPVNRADMPEADFARWVAPEDLAAVMLFLASDGASAVTGALVPVMGRV